MEKTIKINLEEGTFDVEIHGLSLSRISNLSTLPEEIAESLRCTLITAGANPERTAEVVSLVLQRNVGTDYILREAFL